MQTRSLLVLLCECVGVMDATRWRHVDASFRWNDAADLVAVLISRGARELAAQLDREGVEPPAGTMPLVLSNESLVPKFAARFHLGGEEGVCIVRRSTMFVWRADCGAAVSVACASKLFSEYESGMLQWQFPHGQLISAARGGADTLSGRGGEPHEATGDTYESLVYGHGPTLVLYHRPSCGKARRFLPTFNAMARGWAITGQRGCGRALRFVRLDTGANHFFDPASGKVVTGTKTPLLMFFAGRAAEKGTRFMGERTERALRGWLHRLLDEETERREGVCTDRAE